MPDHAQALRAARRTRSQYAIAESLTGLSAALATTNTAEAITHADDALAIADPAEFRLVAGQARTARAVAQAAAGDLGSAVKDAEAAIALHGDAGYRLGEAAALAVLSRVLPDDSEDGRAALRAARAIVAATGATPAILTWPGEVCSAISSAG